MQHEKSCGALVVRREGDQYFILMIRHKAGGNRSFPKGHVEAGETEYATALREVMAYGTLWGVPMDVEITMPLASAPFTAFILLAFMAATLQWTRQRISAFFRRKGEDEE